MRNRSIKYEGERVRVGDQEFSDKLSGLSNIYVPPTIFW
jgi:hypothetical protein